MKILVDPCRYGQIDPARPDRLGILATPRRLAGGFAGCNGLLWAADNDCFQGLDEAAYRRLLDHCDYAPVSPSWVSVPDAVADHAETLRLWKVWVSVLLSRGLPPAFVLQDGCTAATVPWSECAAVFVGGTTAWKLGTVARGICAAAKDRGKAVHVGRVNTRRRINRLASWGTVDTIDGTRWLRFSRSLPTGIAWVDAALGIGSLFQSEEYMDE